MKLTTGLVLVPALALGLAACDVKQTQEGKLPDVEVKDGQVPKYDVNAPAVDVQTEEKKIEVPTGIEYRPPEETENK